MLEAVMSIKIKKTVKRLNVKNAETHRLARKLAKLTGESITVAVTVALREKLEQVREEKAKLAALLKIARQGRKMFKGPHIDHAELLYDENGLPK
jgi:antitoxin VapB